METSSCFLTKSSFIKALGLLPPLKATTSQHRRFLTCCNIQLPDDSEPQIKSDWRSFRAKLVSSEPSSSRPSLGAGGPSPASSAAFGDRWAHPLRSFERGCLLVATEKLNGVHIFERAVVLLLSAGPSAGPTGVILNRPSLMSIKETRSTDLDVAGIFSDRPLNFGGPLEDGLFLVGPVGRGVGEVVGGVLDEVMNGLYYGTKESVGCAAEMVKRGVVGVEDIRFFDGYCGWESDQLRDEIRAGFWAVVACSPSVIGPDGTVGLWEDVLRLVGGRKVW